MVDDAPYEWERALQADGIRVELSLADKGTKVNAHDIHASLRLIPISLETTVTSRTLDTFAARETSFLDSGHLLQR